MKFSKKTEYAVRAALCLASAEPGGEWRQVGQIAAVTGIPEKFLEQILLLLRNAGLLKSRRGVDGGYALNLPSRDIRVFDIVRAIEGPGVHGAEEEGAGGDDFAVEYQALVGAVQEAAWGVLKEATLEVLAARVKARRAAKTRISEYQI